MFGFRNDPPSSPIIDSSSIEKMIREELERNNTYFEFAKSQIESDRRFYAHLYKYAVAFLAFMVVVVGYFQYTSVAQMRNDMKASFETTLENIRVEVKRKIDDEFRSENITKLVEAAATERTEKELATVIRSETSTQVANGIKSKEAEIKGLVESQTRKLVDELEPAMKEIIYQHTEKVVKESLTKMNEQMEKFTQVINIGNQTTLASNDFRPSFDYLIQVAFGMKPESSNIELKAIADSTAAAIIRELTSTIHFTRSFKEKQTNDALKKFMESSNVYEREAALYNYPPDDKSILPMLIHIIETDNSISVVYKATQRFNSLTGQSFEFWKTKDIID
jgi:hypothetical protein